MTDPHMYDAEPIEAVDAEAGDEQFDCAPNVYIRAEYVGGDPTTTRVRDVSVSVPMREDDHISHFGEIIAITLTELAKLGQMIRFETLASIDGQLYRVENGSSPQPEQEQG
jgi:hypothetical protein